MNERIEELEKENARLRRILADTLADVRRMGAEDEAPPTRGWSCHLQAIPMMEVPRLLGETDGFTKHSGGPGVVAPADFDR